MVNLAELKPHVSAVIRDLSGDEIVVERLREIGFVRGEHVSVSGRAPFGDPILIELRGATLALRQVEAQCIQVEMVSA